MLVPGTALALPLYLLMSKISLTSYVVIGWLISASPLVIAVLSRPRFWKPGLAAGSVQL